MTTDSKLHIDFTQLKKELNGDDAAAAKEAERTAIDLAGQGSVEAAEALAGVYSEGTAIIPRDRIQEFRYTRQAADLGSSFSRAWLARLQRESGDLPGALANARQAHEMGEEFGTNLLATMMLAGEGQAANPLEALQMLAESVARGTNTDGAVMLARVYLDGKYFAANPQKAYDTLHAFDHLMDCVTRHIDAAEYGEYLYLKANAIDQGARPAGDETAADLLARAAAFGHEDAADVLRRQADQEAESGRRREWEETARFRAFGGDWQMFYKVGRLEQTQARGGSIALGLQSRDGETMRATVAPGAQLAPGQDYVVVFVGPGAQTIGLPCLVIDPRTGKAVKTTTDITTAYKQNVSRLKLLPCLALGGLALLCFAVGGFLGIVGAAASLFGAFKAWKAYTGGYKRALGVATDFARRHGAAFA